MNCSPFYKSICLTAVIVCVLSTPASGFNLWSRLQLWLGSEKHARELDDQHKQIDLSDPEHGIKMGIPNIACDDGENGIDIDWNPKFLECNPADEFKLKLIAEPIDYEEEEKPAEHVCLDRPIIYDSPLPLNGNHRPLWPKFGEYSFLPPSRWVHSLEHGAVVLLYHPCTTSLLGPLEELETLKNVLRGCLTKYIIAPYSQIPDHMPFALLAFRHARLFGYANVPQAVDFIKTYALQGPETHVLKDGQYGAFLEQGVGNIDNKEMCAQIPD